MPITFAVSDVQPNPVNKERAASHFLESLTEYTKECDSFLQGTAVDLESFRSKKNGFVHTVVDAYNQHHNLVLRPDDVWLAIVSQFALYVDGHAEAVRHLFVKHEGKQEVEVRSYGTLRSADYGALSKLMADKLRERLKAASDPHVADWILPKFSTTTDNDVITGSVMLMGTLKNYFSYKMTLMCGIPTITLEGTLQDWQEIRSRITKLPIYGGNCPKWSTMLSSITDEFVAASEGKINKDFWQRICHYHSGGSGPRYISGWITAFCVFSDKGQWQGDRTSVQTMVGRIDNLEYPVVDSGDIPAGYVTANVLIDDNGTEYNTKMFAGHMGSKIVEETTLAPMLAWGICLKPKAVQ